MEGPETLAGTPPIPGRGGDGGPATGPAGGDAVRRLERALEESEARFSLVVDLAPGAIMISRLADGMILYVNRRIGGMFGMRPDEIVGTTTGRFYADPSDRDRLVAEIRNKGVAENFETTLRRPDGRIFWIMAWAQPITYRGEPALLAVFNDITGTKHLEHQLQQARDEAEWALRAKSRLFAVASHDLRQPLTAFTLFLSALEAQALPPATRPILRAMGEAADAMSRLVDAHLDIARLDAGMARAQPRTVDVAELARSLGAEFEPQARAKGLRLVARAPGPKLATTDPGLLMRILRNLLSNAVRYTERGGIVLACRRRAGSIRIEVWDTGAGIPESQRQAIFEEFHRGGGEHDSTAGGLGIGLSIARRLALLLGHAIELRSRPGKGSVFSVRLEAAAEPLAAPPRPRQASATASLHALRILVVEDDPVVLPALSALLDEWGCVAAAASSAQAALAVCADGFDPAVVIADLRLGTGRSGLDVLRDLCPAGGPRRGLVLTADMSAERLDEVRKAGYAVLRKPVGTDELHRTLLGLTAQAETGMGPDRRS